MVVQHLPPSGIMSMSHTCPKISYGIDACIGDQLGQEGSAKRPPRVSMLEEFKDDLDGMGPGEKMRGLVARLIPLLSTRNG